MRFLKICQDFEHTNADIIIEFFFFSKGNTESWVTGEMENGPYVPSAISSLFLGGRVKALHGHLVVSGVVWYRGKLPGINEDVVGIEIDQVGLGSDGTFQGHRYFRW